MCLGVPGRVTEVEEMTAVVDFWASSGGFAFDPSTSPCRWATTS